jgi:hypothetical protein
MATLIPPRFAYRSQLKPKGKWHLRRNVPNSEDAQWIIGDTPQSACNRIMWETWECRPVQELQASDLCQRCLGAMEVE